MNRPLANNSLRIYYIKSPGESGSHILKLRAEYCFIQIIHCLRSNWSFAITYLIALKFQMGDNLIMERIIIWLALCSAPISQLYLRRKFFSMWRIYVIIYGGHYSLSKSASQRTIYITNSLFLKHCLLQSYRDLSSWDEVITRKLIWIFI